MGLISGALGVAKGIAGGITDAAFNNPLANIGKAAFGFGEDAVGNLFDIASDPLGRDYGAEQAALGREHSTNERLAAESFSSAEAALAREFSSSEAQKARDFQLELSEDEYSRKMRSMREAGLNPVLAAGGWGAGSQVPSSAQAQGAPMASSHAGSSPTAAGAMAPLQALLLAAQVRDISSAAKLKDEQAKDLSITRDPRVNELNAKADLISSQIEDFHASAEQKKALTQNINRELEILNEKLKSAKSQAAIDAAVSDFSTGVGGTIQRWSDAVGLKGRDVTHLIGAVVGLGKFGALLKGVGRSKPKSTTVIPDRIDIPIDWR